MDAEIGVRNLADSFRYNKLPDIVKAMGFMDRDADIEDASDANRLLWIVSPVIIAPKHITHAGQ